MDESILWADDRRVRRGPKPRMSVERIIEAGIGLADADGLAALSMQRVAESLGATKMSLYRYVTSKSDLTALMLDAALGTPPRHEDDDPPERRDDAWRPALRRWAEDLHRGFSDHPWALDVAVGARVLGPNELAWMQAGLRPLAATALTGPERLDVLALLSGHVRGIAHQQSTDPGPERAIGRLMEGILRTHAERYPDVAAAFAESTASGRTAVDQGLSFGIERILDGVGVLIASRGAVEVHPS